MAWALLPRFGMCVNHEGMEKMEISAQTVKELRERTGAGIMDCRKALTEAEGDLARAQAILAQKGAQKMESRVRETKQGLIESYKHPGGQLGALVELNCETDFVSRTEDFRQLAYEIALHVAASNPTYLDRAAIPEEELLGQRLALAEQLRLAGIGRRRPEKRRWKAGSSSG